MDIFGFLKETHGITLNSQQKKGVNNIANNTLLLAVPGSGKTTVLVTRIANLILNHRVLTDDILTITFSKEASLDMKNRFEQLFSSKITNLPKFSTIHSFCYNIIKNYSIKENIKMPTVLNEEQKLSIIKNIFADINSITLSNKNLSTIIELISKIKNTTNVKYRDAILIKYENINLNVIFKQYNMWLKENNFIDFDDLISIAFKIIKKTRFYHENYSHYRYINIDEVQDTSYLQHKLIKLISINATVFMVGDEDQSIYESNNIDYLTNFSNYYDNSNILKIEQNFRCPSHIANTANLFIKDNFSRNSKDMFSDKIDVSCIKYIKIKNYKHQYKIILDLVKKTPNNKKIAILYKNNNSAIPIIDILNINNIGFNIKNHDYKFLYSGVVSDLLSYMDLALNPYDIDAFIKIHDKLGYPKNIAMHLNSNNKNLTIWDSILNINMISDEFFTKTVVYKKYFSIISRTNPIKAIDIILYKIGYYNYLSSFLDKDYAIIDSLHKISIAKQLSINTKNVFEYKEKLSLLNYAPKQYNPDLNLLTIHSSKGMEFDIVILVDIIDGILPCFNSFKESPDIEMERRLFYVAVTRTKEMLYFISSNKLNNQDVKYSSFINLFIKAKDNLDIK